MGRFFFLKSCDRQHPSPRDYIAMKKHKQREDEPNARANTHARTHAQSCTYHSAEGVGFSYSVQKYFTVEGRQRRERRRVGRKATIEGCTLANTSFLKMAERIKVPNDGKKGKEVGIGTGVEKNMKGGLRREKKALERYFLWGLDFPFSLSC